MAERGTAAGREKRGGPEASNCGWPSHPTMSWGSVESINLTPQDVPGDGPAQVVVGNYGNNTSNLDSGSSLNYLAVTLRAGESWSHQPPAGHLIAWMSVAKGRLGEPGNTRVGDLVIFELSDTKIEITAQADTEFADRLGGPRRPWPGARRLLSAYQCRIPR